MEVLLERLATLDAEQVAWAAAGSLAIGAMLLAAAWLYGRLQHDQQRRRVDRAIAASDGAALQPVQEATAGLLEHAGQAAVALRGRRGAARGCRSRGPPGGGAGERGGGGRAGPWARQQPRGPWGEPERAARRDGGPCVRRRARAPAGRPR